MMASTVAGMVFGFVFWRLAGSAMLGILALVQRSVEFVCNLDLLLDEALTRAVIQFRQAGEKGKALWVILACFLLDLVIGLLVFLLVWFWVAPLAPALFRDLLVGTGLPPEEFTHLIRIYAMSILMGTVASSGIGVLQAYERFEGMATLFVADALAKLVLPLGAWWAGLGMRGVLFGFVGQALLYNTLLLGKVWRLVRTEYAGVRPETPSPAECRELLHFAATVTLSRVPKEMMRDLDTLILGRFATSVQVGYYHGAKSYASKLGFFAGPVGAVLFPKLTQHAVEGNWKRFRADILKVAKWMTLITLPILLLMLAGTPVLFAFVHEDWRPILPAILWVLGASLLTNLTCYVRPAIMAVGRPLISVWTNLLMLAVLSGGAVLLAPRTQHVGVAQAWFLTHLVGVAWGAWLVDRAVRHRYHRVP
jgi:O-antigen/teichoic acid export membrane protein